MTNSVKQGDTGSRAASIQVPCREPGKDRTSTTAKLTQTPVYQKKKKKQLLNLRARIMSHRSWEHRDPTGTLMLTCTHLDTHTHPHIHSYGHTHSDTVMHPLAPHIPVCTLAYTHTYLDVVYIHMHRHAYTQMQTH